MWFATQMVWLTFFDLLFECHHHTIEEESSLCVWKVGRGFLVGLQFWL